jgi:predicted AlkP superfamily phosphohydrolase/phosphomutase
VQNPSPVVVAARHAARTAALAALVVAGAFESTPGAGGDTDPAEKQVIVLGFDGMDYAVTRQLMDAGRMPNFQRLAVTGHFAPLETSVPPQSPVAWSSFITGMDAGGHGIFDFIHRDPETMQPYLSTSRTEPGKAVHLGKWRLQWSSGEVVLLRQGAAFWERLTQRGIETTIVRMPANFPPAGTATRELSGMGTPDLLGTYGTFTFYSSEVRAASEVSGGRILPGQPVDGVFTGLLLGPRNPMRTETEELTADFSLYVDPERPLAKLVLGDVERILAEGEWSDWVPVQFHQALTFKLRGMCRFYVKELRPTFQLYVSPINLDPMHAALPISEPRSWAAELALATGRYYTQGMPEDTKAYSAGVFTPSEFLAQAQLAAAENLEQYRRILAEFDRGLLFHYFGNLDQVSHMMWRPMDPAHPAYDDATDAPLAEVVHELYEHMDAVVGHTLQHMDSTAVLVVMSDHGFTSWRRSFHLNAWLQSEGYLAVRDPDVAGDRLSNIDWSRTRAYGLGLNGLYVNLRGRERWGIVRAGEREALLEEIAAKLLETVDHATGQAAVTRADRRETVYRDHGSLELGPDLVVGYAKGTRCADESALGAVASQVFADNASAWSGDHCMDHTAVPGILLTNRELHRPVRHLAELGTAIVAEFGIDASRSP